MTIPAVLDRVYPLCQRLAPLGALLRLAWREHRPWLAFVAACVVASAAASPWLGWRPADVGLYTGQALVGIAALPAVVLLATRWRLMRRGGPTPSFAAVSGALWRRHGGAARLTSVVVAALGIALLMATFTGWKLLIPRLQPFAYDVAFMRLDAALHGGRHPWEWLQPLVGYPAVTRALDVLYFSIWFPVVLMTATWMAWSRPSPRRTQYLLTYVLTWVLLGVVMATLFSSAGPCYFGQVTGQPDPYVPLMAYLRGVHEASPTIALAVQDGLWATYMGQGSIPGAGISAMPSLHVAMAELTAIAVWGTNRRLGVAFGVYALLTLVASVALGPHYAVDGYVSIVAVHVIWWVAGRLAGAGRTRPRAAQDAEGAPGGGAAGRWRAGGTVTHAAGI